MSNLHKILIIRFSSFGDIVQASSVCIPLKQKFPQAQLHWVTRSDMSGFLSCISEIDHVWSFDSKLGLRGLLSLAMKLRAENYTHVYDAHSNTRSFILGLFLRFFSSLNFVKRSKERWKRFYLFTLRINKFPKPYRGILSYLKPLTEWGVDPVTSKPQVWSFQGQDKDLVDQLIAPTDILLVPSAAWEMKRWPLQSWKKLIEISSSHRFVVLGGPADTFCQQLEEIAPQRVTNLAGKLSLTQSCYAVQRASLLVSADTGLLHVADVFGKPGIALIGPTAFGFPTSSLIKVLEVPLSCRPCTKDGRGKCSQAVYQKCMVDITPEMVEKELQDI